MILNCVVFNKNEIHRPLSFIDKLSSDCGLLSKTKFNLEDLYLNIIWSFCYWKKKNFT